MRNDNYVSNSRTRMKYTCVVTSSSTPCTERLFSKCALAYRFECTNHCFKFNYMTDIARSGSVILGHFTFFGGGGGSSNINKIRFDRLGVNRFRSSWDEVPKRVFLGFKF